MRPAACKVSRRWTRSYGTSLRSEDARGYSRVVKEVVPAVVNISSSRVTKNETSGMQGQPSMDPFLRHFFEIGRRAGLFASSQGSGAGSSEHFLFTRH